MAAAADDKHVMQCTMPCGKKERTGQGTEVQNQRLSARRRSSLPSRLSLSRHLLLLLLLLPLPVTFLFPYTFLLVQWFGSVPFSPARSRFPCPCPPHSLSYTHTLSLRNAAFLFPLSLSLFFSPLPSPLSPALIISSSYFFFLLRFPLSVFVETCVNNIVTFVAASYNNSDNYPASSVATG